MANQHPLIMSNADSSLRCGPQRLDRFVVELRWKPSSIMPPVLSGTLVVADSSMPHILRVDYRLYCLVMLSLGCFASQPPAMTFYFWLAFATVVIVLFAYFMAISACHSV